MDKPLIWALKDAPDGIAIDDLNAGDVDSAIAQGLVRVIGAWSIGYVTLTDKGRAVVGLPPERSFWADAAAFCLRPTSRRDWMRVSMILVATACLLAFSLYVVHEQLKQSIGSASSRDAGDLRL